MYETILVPLDGSARAEAIIPHVEELAHRHESRVIFLQVIEHAPAMMSSSSGSAQAVEVSVEEMKRRTRDAETYLASK